MQIDFFLIRSKWHMKISIILPVKSHSFGKVSYLFIVSPIFFVSRYNLLILFIAQQHTEFPFPLIHIGHCR